MVETGAHESNSDTSSVTGNSKRTVKGKVAGQSTEEVLLRLTLPHRQSFLNKYLTKVSLILRRVDRKLLMFSKRRLAKNLIMREPMERKWGVLRKSSMEVCGVLKVCRCNTNFFLRKEKEEM